MISSPIIIWSAESYRHGLSVTLPKSHNTHPPWLCWSTFSGFRSLHFNESHHRKNLLMAIDCSPFYDFLYSCWVGMAIIESYHQVGFGSLLACTWLSYRKWRSFVLKYSQNFVLVSESKTQENFCSDYNHEKQVTQAIQVQIQDCLDLAHMRGDRVVRGPSNLHSCAYQVSRHLSYQHAKIYLGLFIAQTSGKDRSWKRARLSKTRSWLLSDDQTYIEQFFLWTPV